VSITGGNELSDSIAPVPRQLPELEPETAFFWQSGADGCLRILRCSQCGRYQHPPWPRCPACGSEDVAPAVVSGKGLVKTYTVNVQPWVAGLEAPFVFAGVELDEQPELYVFSNILAPPDAVRSGMRVEVTFEQREDVYLPLFKPMDSPND
jgi:uncharacterized OB-fold protein